MSNDPVIQAIRQALAADSENLTLQKHLADLLYEAGDFAAAEKEYRQVLAKSPDDQAIKLALADCFYQQEKWMVAVVVLEELLKSPQPPARAYLLAARAYQKTAHQHQAIAAYQQAIRLDPDLNDASLEAALGAESDTRQISDASPPPPVRSMPAQASRQSDDDEDRVRIPIDGWPRSTSDNDDDLERPTINFEHVGGMETIKEEIRLKIIHPLNHPEIYQAYGKTIGGGILMYGPPGCGKTHLARATAGEVNAYFISIGIHDVLNMWLGQSEQNLHQLFQLARRNRPCVIFIDEVDALGANRSDMRQSAGRQVINQLLSELDGIDGANDGVLVLAATNMPWHLDSALRRPGRFDRILFVPPPDTSARAAITEVLLKGKPTRNLDYDQIARRTEGFSGADLKAMVDQAIEYKLHSAMRSGVPSPLETQDLLRVVKNIRPSTRDWFATARNYALYADDILTYMKTHQDSGLFSKMQFWKGGS